MTADFADIVGGAVCDFHDTRVGDPQWPKATTPTHVFRRMALDRGEPPVQFAAVGRGGLARRIDVGDAAIAANKRAIDGYNQNRNDAVERLDETLLERLEDVAPQASAWHNSESAGAMIDRLSILALKTFHMGRESTRSGATDVQRDLWRNRHALLCLQRSDLARCLDTLLVEAAAGRAFWRVYRQFKMYNDADLNPYLRRR